MISYINPPIIFHTAITGCGVQFNKLTFALHSRTGIAQLTSAASKRSSVSSVHQLCYTPWRQILSLVIKSVAYFRPPLRHVIYSAGSAFDRKMAAFSIAAEIQFH
jgi:hypothetical protein